MRPRVSVITPTHSRSKFLQLTRQCFLSQTYRNAEWLILDDSESKDPNFGNADTGDIRYFHSGDKLTIGEKRNFLIEKASGEIIIHFDDDDFYAPNYVEKAVGHLCNNDFDLLNLRGFFVFDHLSRNLFYWNLMLKVGGHFEVGRNRINLRVLNEQNNGAFSDIHLGYGFGWTYRKKVWERKPFEKVNWGEDKQFALSAQQGFRLGGLVDQSGICLHFIHRRNSSTCLPQYVLPPFLVQKFFDVMTTSLYEAPCPARRRWLA